TAVIFVKSRTLFIVELKTTVGDPGILYQDQEFQAGIYGLILEGMGFDCRELTLAIVRWRRNEPVTDEQRKEFLSIAMLALPSKEPKLIEELYRGKHVFILFPLTKRQSSNKWSGRKTTGCRIENRYPPRTLGSAKPVNSTTLAPPVC